MFGDRFRPHATTTWTYPIARPLAFGGQSRVHRARCQLAVPANVSAASLRRGCCPVGFRTFALDRGGGQEVSGAATCISSTWTPSGLPHTFSLNGSEGSTEVHEDHIRGHAEVPQSASILTKTPATRTTGQRHDMPPSKVEQTETVNGCPVDSRSKVRVTWSPMQGKAVATSDGWP